MKYMLIMRTTDAAHEAYRQVPFEQIIDRMGAYNEALTEAGVLVAGEGLADDPSTDFVVDFAAEAPGVVEVPSGETPDRFSGFWILRVASKEEAIEWATRCPLGPGSTLEVRRLIDMSDLAASST